MAVNVAWTTTYPRLAGPRLPQPGDRRHQPTHRTSRAEAASAQRACTGAEVRSASAIQPSDPQENSADGGDNNNNKRPLTPKSMPPAGDEHAKLKT